MRKLISKLRLQQPGIIIIKTFNIHAGYCHMVNRLSMMTFHIEMINRLKRICKMFQLREFFSSAFLTTVDNRAEIVERHHVSLSDIRSDQDITFFTGFVAFVLRHHRNKTFKHFQGVIEHIGIGLYNLQVNANDDVDTFIAYISHREVVGETAVAQQMSVIINGFEQERD